MGTTVVVNAAVYDALDLPALLAEQDGRIVGLLTYLASDEGLEVVSMDATVRRSGTVVATVQTATQLATQWTGHSRGRVRRQSTRLPSRSTATNTMIQRSDTSADGAIR